MSSNDGSITLTTHRVLQRTRHLNKEMMLSDFLSYEQVRKRNRYYRNLAIFFLVTTISLGIWYTNVAREAETFRSQFREAMYEAYGNSSRISMNEEVQLSGGLFGFSTFLLIIAFVLYLISNKKQLRIDGKFSTIEFPINNLSNESFSKFTNALITESDNRKRE